jgi:homoserine/homoserine lactone efflux protein
MQTSTWALFLPTFFFVSVTPGLCMTLALTLGMSIGVKRSLHMMWGELLGVGLIGVLAGVGMAAVMLKYPDVFTLLKTLGAMYLGWLGIQLWRSKGSLALPLDGSPLTFSVRPLDLAMKGFVTAVANPKGWAFFISLLPPFLDSAKPLGPQLLLLLSIILTIEFVCLLIYASGGQALRHLLLNQGNVRLLNRIAGGLMVGVGVWLFVG